MFWRREAERMWRDRADHEWTMWKIAASQGNEIHILKNIKF